MPSDTSARRVRSLASGRINTPAASATSPSSSSSSPSSPSLGSPVSSRSRSISPATARRPSRPRPEQQAPSSTRPSPTPTPTPPSAQQQEQEQQSQAQHQRILVPQPRSVILDRQNQSYRYSLRPASVARFPSPHAEQLQSQQQQQRSFSERSPTFRRQSPSKSYEKVAGPSRTASPAPTASGPSRRGSKDEAAPIAPLSEAAKRGQKRLSCRIVTDIDSPSPSEPPSRTPSRAATVRPPQGPTAGAIDAAPRAEAGASTATAGGLSGRSDTLRLPSLPDGSRPNSKVLTSFPFPHPTTPSGSKLLGANSFYDREGAEHTESSASGRGLPVRVLLAPLHAVGRWIDRATNLFAGPYERRLMREEAEDDALTRQIVERLERGQGALLPGSQRSSMAEPLAVPLAGGNQEGRGGDKAPQGERAMTSYGTFSTQQPRALYLFTGDATTTATATSSSAASSSSAGEVDPSDPYGYRRLAGPVLLPAYNADLATRRRERRRARSRARFQCMALWTIWTVSLVLVLLVLGSGASVWKDWKQHLPDPDSDGVGGGVGGIGW